MKLIQVLRTVMLVCVGLGSLSIAAEKERALPDKEKAQGTVHTVQAGVGYPTNAGVGIQAEKQPGSFTIPKGSQATKLKYSFADPKSDYTSTKLRGSNIYSVTEKRYMHELDKDPNFVLPPGEYKFVVGGSPGATGSLSYTTVPSSGTSSPPKPPGGPKGPPGHSSPPAGFPKPGDEEVLLNLPRDFDVAVPDLSPLPPLMRNEKTEKPVVLRFRGQTMRSSYDHTMAPNATSFPPSQVRGTFMMSGTFYRGQLTGSATFVAFNRDIRQGIDFTEFKSEADVQGQANADGRLTIKMKWKFFNVRQRSAGAAPAGLIQWGAWKDLPREDLGKGLAESDSQFTVQLPVGQLQSSQKLTPE